MIKQDGSWIYSPENNSIVKISNKIADDAGAVELVYVVNLKKTLKINYANLHAGSMSQNAGLYCASVGLNNVVRGGSFDRKKITQKLKLNKNQEILITQKIGWGE